MSAWQLEKVQVKNLLGFQGLKEQHFQPRIQVVEAPNHTGKTSLTMALLWGLTGNIPELPRINRHSFRLSNKHAGIDAEQFCVIELVNDSGHRMAIKRLYRGARANLDTELTVELDDTMFSGQDAQTRILEELKVRPDSLEGCGVVLQDHRLGFITGKDSDISNVISDMLGLTVLSRFVPTLEERLKEAKELQKEITNYLDAADPLKKWEEREQQLKDDFLQRENEAIEAGLAREDLENPTATAARELAQIAASLKAAPAQPGRSIPDEIKRLRDQLAVLRKSSPLGVELAELQRRKGQLSQWAEKAVSVRDSYRDFNERLAAEDSAGELDTRNLTDTIAEKETALQKNQGRRDELASEKGLLTNAYSHMQSHQNLRACPVCSEPIKASDLLKKLKNRVEDQIASELSRLKEQQKTLSEEKDRAENRLKAVNRLKDKHGQFFGEINDFQAQIRDEPFYWKKKFEIDSLFLDADLRMKMVEVLRGVADQLNEGLRIVTDELKQKKTQIEQQEAEQYQPAEARITRVSEKLLPVMDAAQKIENHGRKRDRAAQRKTELEQLQEDARTLSGQLQKVASVLTQQEEETASAAIRARLPGISEFFRSVARNPDYDSLDIQTSISRDRVTYKIQATSSAIGNLNDTVGHVLSEGDLSAASMALLLGLASGESHHLGFLVLDDPAQGMDETLQDNLAAAIVKLGKPKQVVIFTHQRSFAEALKQAGAQHSRMHSWKMGKVQDA